MTQPQRWNSSVAGCLLGAVLFAAAVYVIGLLNDWVNATWGPR